MLAKIRDYGAALIEANPVIALYVIVGLSVYGLLATVF